MSDEIRCHVCAARRVDLVAGYPGLCRVTSDSRPWPRGGHLGVCGACGCVQKLIDSAWEAEVREIYESYTIYHQSSGAEQLVFVDDAGRGLSRSERLLQCLATQMILPTKARLLDIGCGNGAMLRACARFAPNWTLAGTELSDKYQTQVEEIPGVEKLYTCSPAQVPGAFEFITMVHVLEHILAPQQFLAKLSDKLAAGGRLLIEIPDYLQNPFDLLIADHCTHFNVETIARVAEGAGQVIVASTSNWVPKELTVLARSRAKDDRLLGNTPAPAVESVTRQVRWLEAVAASARDLACSGSCGIFGTSVAGTWLFAEMEGMVAYFVDEDPARVGRTYMGRPVYHPADVPTGGRVFLAQPPPVATHLKTRLEQTWPNCVFVPPPVTGGES